MKAAGDGMELAVKRVAAVLLRAREASLAELPSLAWPCLSLAWLLLDSQATERERLKDARRGKN